MDRLYLCFPGFYIEVFQINLLSTITPNTLMITESTKSNIIIQLDKDLSIYRYQYEYNINYYQMLIWWFFVFYYALRHWLLWGIIYVFSSHKSVLDWQKLHGWHIFIHLVLLSHLYRNRNMRVYINWHIFRKISIFVTDFESNF